jgi:uncharacterized repeat protein (TIGR02543 family)
MSARTVKLPAAIAVPSARNAPLGHTCSFSDQWSKDESNHWHGCSCGEIADLAAHNFGSWAITREPTETTAGSKERQCAVCQYKQVVVMPATAEYLIVTFDTQGGSPVANESVKNGSKVTKPEDPVFDGYVFGGWYTTASGEIPWNFNQPVYQATTLYAKWVKYTITNGADGSWEIGTESGFEIICNGDYLKFTGIKVDGVEVDATNYTAVSGSTVITLKPSFMETLALGKHTLELVYTDGSVQTEFTISAAGDPTDPTETADPKELPKTSGETGYIWLFGLILSLSACVALMFLCKPKTERAKQ